MSLYVRKRNDDAVRVSLKISWEVHLLANLYRAVLIRSYSVVQEIWKTEKNYVGVLWNEKEIGYNC